MATHDLQNPSFDYSVLSKDEKGKLIYFEGALFSSRKRAADELIKHGEILHDVQQLLSNHHNGTFGDWLNSVGLSRRTAYNAIAAYEHFGGCANLHNLEVSAIYALTSNPDAKKRALKLADKGTKVTHAMAQKLIGDATKPAAAPPIEPELIDNTQEETRGDGASGCQQKPDSSGLPPTSCEPETAQPPPSNGTPPRQFDRSFWYKQWDQSIGPLCRLVEKIANNLDESHCELHDYVKTALDDATERMGEWMGVDE
jgi:hypothetical protein